MRSYKNFVQWQQVMLHTKGIKRIAELLKRSYSRHFNLTRLFKQSDHKGKGI
jgi:hypothetical protein